MTLAAFDWWVLAGYLLLTLILGLWAARRAGHSSSDFFLAGRSRPWWLLGISMVATTFSTDTPNLVADITRTSGIAGNWIWWAFLLTGMLTTFVYARLWRRSGIVTDLAFYEIRYSGPPAAFLRGFRALYLGVLFNVMVMATVTLAAIKIGGALFGLSPLETITVAILVTVVFSAAGGLAGVLFTDLLLFLVAMAGSVAAAVVALRHPQVGGLAALVRNEAVRERLSVLPDFSDPASYVPLFVIPLAVQWWASWYPGAEPGGGGYVAQRMLAARDERHALGATLLFNVAHYALRPWPWIIVALASLVIFPDLEALQRAVPHLDPAVVKDDLAYPAMLVFLPAGLLGLVVGSLAAAYMSTISTHLNWGASYIVNDFYHRFVRPNADERELVRVGRTATVLLMILAAFVALQLESALESYQILLQIGAGTGLLFILRWFWWRINAWSELAAMVVSFAVAIFFQVAGEGFEAWEKLLLGVALTTVAWVGVTLATAPTEEEKLRDFYRRTSPGGLGWRAVRARAAADGEVLQERSGPSVGTSVAAILAGCVAVYGALFAGGQWFFGKTAWAWTWTITAALASLCLFFFYGQMERERGSV